MWEKTCFRKILILSFFSDLFTCLTTRVLRSTGHRVTNEMPVKATAKFSRACEHRERESERQRGNLLTQHVFVLDITTLVSRTALDHTSENTTFARPTTPPPLPPDRQTFPPQIPT